MSSKMTPDQWEDVAQRAIATFWQGAVAAAPVTVAADWGAIRSGLLAMAIGGGAALLSTVKGMVKAKRNNRT
jgi:hypothetical protein